MFKSLLIANVYVVAGGGRQQKWFVYDMTKKANQNNLMIAQVLGKLRARLELLAQELAKWRAITCCKGCVSKHEHAHCFR